MIKFLHTSDWHLGKMIYGRSILSDQVYFINQFLLPLIKEEKPDFLILAGDIYDRQIASVDAIRVFDGFVSELNKLDVPLLSIVGNHDWADRIAIGTKLLRNNGIYIASNIEDVFEPVHFSKDGEEVDVYLLPYFELSQARYVLTNNDIKNIGEAYSIVINRILDKINKNHKNILVSHCFVNGTKTSDSENALYLGGSCAIGCSEFKQFDYVALGHLHSPQKVGKNGRYSGSPIKYSFDEVNQQKSVVMGTTDKNEISTQLVPVTSFRDMRKISGTLNDLLEAENVKSDEDYLYVTLTDEEPVFMPMEKLRVKYPNILGLSSNWLKASVNNRKIYNDLRKSSDDVAIFKVFMKQICDVDVDEDDINLFERARLLAVQE